MITKFLGMDFLAVPKKRKDAPNCMGGIVVKLMKYILYLGIGCQIVDAVLTMRREAAQAGQHGLTSLTRLNERLGLNH
jgi:hypothetical protein